MPGNDEAIIRRKVQQALGDPAVAVLKQRLQSIRTNTNETLWTQFVCDAMDTINKGVVRNIYLEVTLRALLTVAIRLCPVDIEQLDTRLVAYRLDARVLGEHLLNTILSTVEKTLSENNLQHEASNGCEPELVNCQADEAPLITHTEVECCCDCGNTFGYFD